MSAGVRVSFISRSLSNVLTSKNHRQYANDILICFFMYESFVFQFFTETGISLVLVLKGPFNNKPKFRKVQIIVCHQKGTRYFQR